MVDHDAATLRCWQLAADGKSWFEPKDIDDPMYNGKVIPDVTEADYPPLPKD